MNTLRGGDITLFRGDLGLFHQEELLLLREARLLALAFPDEVASLASTVAQDPQAGKKDRNYSLYLLGTLAREGSVQADGVLFRLAKDPDNEIADEALRNLIRSDKDGRYLPLYWEHCKEWRVEAFEGVSRWGNASSVPLMRQIAASTPRAEYPESEIHLLAEEVLHRVSILSSPNWEAQLTQVLEDTKGEYATWTEWALSVAAQKAMPSLLQVLRRRLDAAHEEVERMIKKGFEDNLVTNPSSHSITKDGYFDEVLVAYWRSGGKLTDRENERLYIFGYACDPKQRLEELLASEK